MVVGLPSKKIMLLVAACAIGVGSVGFAVFATKNAGSGNTSTLSANENSDKLSLIDQNLELETQKDDDNDGLMNWEEPLWKTDPHNPDTDGDGTKDGDEVKLGRNPLVAGPNDTSASGGTDLTNANAKPLNSGEAKAQAAEDAKFDTTQTAKMSRELFANYMAAKQSGSKMDAATQKQIILQTISNKAVGYEPKVYLQSQINVSADPDMKKYGNSLGEAFYAGTTNTSVTETQILDSAISKQSSEEFKKLTPIIESYGEIVKKLAAISVPSNFVELHLELVNSVSRVQADIHDFSLIIEDPIAGLAGVSAYYKDMTSMQNAIDAIESVFKKNQITFTSTEYGYVFQKIIQ